MNPESFKKPKIEQEKETLSVRIGDTVKEVAPSFAIGAAVAGASFVGAKIDHFLNPELVDTLSQNFHFYNFLTTEHALAALVEKYGMVSNVIAGSIAGVSAYLSGYGR